MFYNNGLRPGGRRPRLYLARGREVVKFTGDNIAGWCAVMTAEYTKSGKWSNTDYTLDLSPGVRPLEFLSPLHGSWGDELGSWGEVAELLALPIDAAQAVIRAEYEATAKRLDDLEAFVLAKESVTTTVETVVVSFGSPTNRQTREGYWEADKTATTTDGQTVTIRPSPTTGWSDPEVVAPIGAKVLSSEHRPGMHGGYWSVEVAVPSEVVS